MSQTFARLSIFNVALIMDMCRKNRWKNTDSGKPECGGPIQARTKTFSVSRRFSPDMKFKGYEVEQSPLCSAHVKNPLGQTSTALWCSHYHHKSNLHSTDRQV
jgi:hypothetical protein